MVYPVSCTAVCYVTVITLFIKKVGVVRPNFGGPDPHPPLVAPLHGYAAWGIVRERVATSRGRSGPGVSPPRKSFENLRANSYFLAHFQPENELIRKCKIYNAFPYQAVLYAPSTG